MPLIEAPVPSDAVDAPLADPPADRLAFAQTQGMGDGADNDLAVADEGFVMNECTVVMRHNADTDRIEFFCDVGLPVLHARDTAHRIALELNLCRTYPGIMLGVHPESARLVATTSMHSQRVTDDAACIQVLEMLTLQVRLLRESGVIEFE